MFIIKDELARRFNYHQPQSQDTIDAYQTVRDSCRETAEKIVDVTVAPSREQSLAITALEEAMFWANAAIARNGPKVVSTS